MSALTALLAVGLQLTRDAGDPEPTQLQGSIQTDGSEPGLHAPMHTHTHTVEPGEAWAGGWGTGVGSALGLCGPRESGGPAGASRGGLPLQLRQSLSVLLSHSGLRFLPSRCPHSPQICPETPTEVRAAFRPQVLLPGPLPPLGAPRGPRESSELTRPAPGGSPPIQG